MRVAVVTLFPEMLEPLVRGGVTGRAIERGLLELALVDPRCHAHDRHRRVDDRPYGGGPGMVMLVDPLHAALGEARGRVGGVAHTVYLSPQGRRLDQALVQSLSREPALVLLCGRYEGVDERLLEAEVDAELSLGDYVLSGGEIAAAAVVDAMARLLPGALGHELSAVQESHVDGLLDCPQYTRPPEALGRRVPEVLLRGNHEAIRRWRLKQSLGRTWLRRPDMIAAARLDGEQRALLDEFMAEHG